MFKKKPAPEWSKSGSFLRKPTLGWLHSDDSISQSGVSYAVKYLGCIRILQSMRTLPYDIRLQVTREAMYKICETKGLKFAKRKKPSKNVAKILADHPQGAPIDPHVSLTISSSGLKIVGMKTGEIVANHDMQGISFTSGGEKEAASLVGYVAKDDVNGRACHVLDCGENLAFDVITTIGQAFELRYKQFLHNPPQALQTPERFVESIFETPDDDEDTDITMVENGDNEYETPRQEGGGYQEHNEYKVPGPAVSATTKSFPDYQTPANVPTSMYAVLEEPKDAFDNFNKNLIDLSGPQFAAGAVYDNPNSGGMAVFNNPLSSPTSQGQMTQNLLYDNKNAVSAPYASATMRSDNIIYDSADERKPSAEVTINSAYDNPQRILDPNRLNWMKFDNEDNPSFQNIQTRPPPPPPMSTNPEYATVEEPEYAQPNKRSPDQGGVQPKRPPPKPAPYAASKLREAQQPADQQPEMPAMGELKDALPAAPVTDIQASVWFHGAISRVEAEHLLEDDGDFLVRESKSRAGQYVLSGMQNNQVKHILLVDPKGEVRTKDRAFGSVPELIDYHLKNDRPIVSAGSSVKLVKPVIAN